MLERLLALSIRRRGLVLLLTALVAAFGVYNFQRLPIDAVPDITNVQVVVSTQAPGYTPLEVEQRITFPLENAMAGLPRLDHTRSVSRYGLSQITAVFEETADALSKITREIERYFKERAKHQDVGSRLIAAWEDGVRNSLGFADRT